MSEQTKEAVSLCCGGPAPKETGSCCVQDAEAKAAGTDGCGCNVTVRVEREKPAAVSCCGS